MTHSRRAEDLELDGELELHFEVTLGFLVAGT